MERTVYVNGVFLEESAAQVSIFDRGFLFADGVYEVSAVVDGKLVDNDRHLARLSRSASALRLRLPLTKLQLAEVQQELVERNDLNEGAVYLQLTRGAADRSFSFSSALEPTLVMFTQRHALLQSSLAQRGAKVRLVPDSRWARCDIKTIQLLAASLELQAAIDAGFDDAWFTTDGYVKEATSANAFIVTADGRIVTRSLGQGILGGITREVVFEIARQRGLGVEERPVSVMEAYDAKEAFMSSATKFIMGVVSLDGHVLGDGNPGELTTDLRSAYIDRLVSRQE